MTVYIEIVFLDNFTMDLSILWAASVTLGKKIGFGRLCLAACVGAACAVATPFLVGMWLYVVKTLALFAMCFVAVGFGKKTFWYICIVLAYTFVSGGAIVAAFNFLQIDYTQTFYQAEIPLFVFFVGIFVAAFLCYSLANYVKERGRIAPFLVKAKVTFGGDTVVVTGFCDSGNTLVCNGLPVCFVTGKLRGFCDFVAKQTLAGKVITVDVCTVCGKAKVVAVEGECEVNGESTKVLFALPVAKCPSVYDVILNGVFVVG